MKALASVSGGLCAFEGDTRTQYVNVAAMTTVAPEVAHFVATTLDDWEVVRGGTKEAILGEVKNRYERARLVANIESCLCGVSAPLENVLLQEAEDLLRLVPLHSEIVALLLRAPLARVGSLRDLIEVCLAKGFAAVARLLEEVRESQAPLQRVADRWLALPDELFQPIPAGRSYVWRLAVGRSVVLKTLYATQFVEVEQAWAALVFEGSQPHERKTFGRIASVFARSLFPDSQLLRTTDIDVIAERDAYDSTDHERSSRGGGRSSGKALFDQAIKQVNAIAAAVAKGQDARARAFLDDLVGTQTARRGGAEYAVKSLCNIAQQSAAMYRTDFEYECLQTALAIKPYDPYVLIQLADHFKRVGRFDDALKVINDAEGLGNELIRQSSLADVYTQMGRFDEAIAIYDRLLSFGSDPVLSGAKANVLRRCGRLEEARLEYQRLSDEGFQDHRVKAGLAEIAKRLGHLQDAERLYQSVVDTDLPEADRVIYESALASVLVRRGNFQRAYKYLDQVVQLRPFAFDLRAYRAAVAGLLGNPDQAIRDLPDVGHTHAFNEWVNGYVRGLLLLMLDRYADARTALLQQIQHGLLDREASEMVGLAAAVSFMRTKAGMSDAARRLDEAAGFGDAFGDQIRAALKYHIAVAQNRRADVDRLRLELETVTDPAIRSVVIAIDRREWRKAWELEVRILLRLAA